MEVIQGLGPSVCKQLRDFPVEETLDVSGGIASDDWKMLKGDRFEVKGGVCSLRSLILEKTTCSISGEDAFSLAAILQAVCGVLVSVRRIVGGWALTGPSDHVAL